MECNRPRSTAHPAAAAANFFLSFFCLLRLSEIHTLFSSPLLHTLSFLQVVKHVVVEKEVVKEVPVEKLVEVPVDKVPSITRAPPSLVL